MLSVGGESNNFWTEFFPSLPSPFSLRQIACNALYPWMELELELKCGLLPSFLDEHPGGKKSNDPEIFSSVSSAVSNCNAKASSKAAPVLRQILA